MGRWGFVEVVIDKQAGVQTLIEWDVFPELWEHQAVLFPDGLQASACRVKHLEVSKGVSGSEVGTPLPLPKEGHKIQASSQFLTELERRLD